MIIWESMIGDAFTMPPKGYHHTEEAKRKMSKTHTGKPSPHKGRPQTDEHKNNISIALKGKPKPPFTEEHRMHMSMAFKGRKLSSETRQKMSIAKMGNKNSSGHKPSDDHKRKLSEALRGEKSYLWLGGVSFEPYCPKFNNAFKKYIRTKFDNKCFICNKDDERTLAVHHIDYAKNSICNGKEWAFVPLCMSCHSKTNVNRWYWFNLLINYWAMNKDINFS